MNIVKSILITFLVVIGFFSLNAQSNTLQKADKYYELFAFNLAVENYEAALAQNPNVMGAMVRLADCYRHLNQLDKAEKWYKKIVLSPEKEDVDLFLYATVLNAQGKYQDAKKWFDAYAKTNLPVGSHYASSCNYAMNNLSKISPFEVKREFVINSAGAEFAPVFYGDKLLFSSFRKSVQTTTELDKETNNQLYLSERNSSGDLLEANILKKGIKTSLNVGYASFDDNYNTVAFVKNNNNFSNGVLPLTGSGVKMDIYLGRAVDAANWEDISAFPYNDGESSNGYPFLSDDGRKLYFASNRSGGYGGFDIYVSAKIGNTWSEPKNLGSIINTAGNEISPFMEGTTLFFASDWHLGFGGLDLFKADRKGNYSWGPVKNLGPKVNSPANDYDLIFDNDTDEGYFVSNRKGGKGKDDLFKISRSTTPQTVLVSVYSSDTQLPLNGATIDLSNCGYGVVKTNEKGLASIPDFKEVDCDLVIQKIGFSARKVALVNHNPDEQVAVYIDPLNSYFIGQVKNSETEDVLSGVVVKLIDNKNDVVAKAISDNKGRYSLSLLPSTSYNMVCSKIGFVNKEIKVVTKDKIGEDFLASIEMEPTPFVDLDVPVAASVRNVPTATQNIPTATKSAPTPSDWRTSEDLVAKGIPTPALPEAKTTSTLSIDDGILTTSEVMPTEHILATIPDFSEGTEVYEVQIGAFSNPDFNKLAALGDIGLVYSDRRDNLYLYKVGTYKTQEEAIQAMKRIKSRGYKDAFVRKVTDFNPIVSAINNISKTEEEVVTTQTPQVTYSSEPKYSPPITYSSTPENTYTTPQSTVTTTSIATPVFKVQLGAFKQSTAVSYSDNLLSAGQVYSTTNDKGVTIYLLGDFMDLESARAAKVLAQKEGVPSPFIVAYKNGRKISVQEALKK